MIKKVFKKMGIGLCFCLSLNFTACTLTSINASTDLTKQKIKLVKDYLYKLEKGTVSFTAQLKSSYVTSNTGKSDGKVDTAVVVYDKTKDDLYMKVNSGTKSSIEILERKIHSKKCMTYQLSKDGHKWNSTKVPVVASKNTAQISAESSLLKKILTGSSIKFDKAKNSLVFTAGQFNSYKYTLAGNKLTRVDAPAPDVVKICTSFPYKNGR